MKEIQQNRQILIIAGMHRSGTSLLAQLLNDAGLRLGSRLLPAAESNRKGHFENLDFVEFHKKLLCHHQVDTDGWTLEESFQVPETLRQEAHSVVDRNSQTEPWGWKDPRTTLFLDFWATELPEAKFVFVHRAPWEVIDSLFRRSDAIFQTEPQLSLRVWQHYNRLVLNFAQRFPDRSVIVDVDSIAANARQLTNLIAERLDIQLSFPKETTFEASLMKKEVATTHWPQLFKTLFPEAHALWKELKQASSQLGEPTEDQLVDHDECTSEELAELMMQDWMVCRKTEAELSKVEDTLYQVRSELFHARANLQSIENSRLWKMRNKLRGIRARLPKE